MKEIWHSVTIEIAREDSGTASHLFHEAGCNGVWEDELKGQNRVRLCAYFRADKTQSELSDNLKNAFKPFPAFASLTLGIVTSAQNEWRDKWRQWFKPFEIASGLIVAPSWEEYKTKTGETLITLDPGMAFGTGLHETTKLCAEAIFNSLAGRSSLLDVGTGSGLLAIVAAKLGVQKIAAVENDPDAVLVARENFKINGIEGIEVASSLDLVAEKFEIVVANILLMTLIELKDRLVHALAPKGILILSGITRDQEERLKAAFSPPLDLVKTTTMKEWSCMIFCDR